MRNGKWNLRNKVLKGVLALLIIVFFLPVQEVKANAPNGIAWNGTAGIKIDINSAPYTTYATYSWGENAYTEVGCAWFASARVHQLTGANCPIWAGTAWYNRGYSSCGFSRGTTLRAKALACYEKHVSVIEVINGDTVTISEGGYSGNGIGSANGYCAVHNETKSYITEYQFERGNFLGYVYLTDDEISGDLKITAKSTYYTDEDITFSWNSPTNAVKYGITLYTRPASGNRVMVFDLPSLTTAHSYNLGKLEAGDYRLWMAPYNSSGTRGNTVYVDFTVKKHTHSYTSKVTKKATCTSEGVKTYTCSCGKSYTEKIAKTAHKAVTDKAVAATCTKEGKTEGSHCSVCKKVIKAQKKVAKTAHKAVTDKAVAATCSKEGKTEGSHCSVCKAVIKAQKTIAKTAHKAVTDEAVEATCTSEGKTEGSHCSVCNTVIKAQQATPLKEHSYEQTSIEKATADRSGNIYYECSECAAASSEIIPKVETIKLSETNFTYNGFTRKPSITVKDNAGNKLKKGTDYTVSYAKKTKNIGQYKVTIKFKGNYSGSVKKTYSISPKGTKLNGYKVKSKSQVQVSWKKQSKSTNGYEIQYSTNSGFKKSATKTVLVKKNTATKATLKSLKQNKKYYIRIRTYKNVKENGKTVKVYSKWSKTMTMKYSY